MYFEDLTLYSYREREIRNNLYNIGWLEKGHEYPIGEVPSKFIDKLWDYSHFAVADTRGFHTCDLCEYPLHGIPEIEYRAKVLKVGSAELRIFGNDGKIFATPNLLFHYVTVHKYKPPIQFVDSVIDGIDPYSKEYQTLLSSIVEKWRMLEET